MENYKDWRTKNLIRRIDTLEKNIKNYETNPNPGLTFGENRRNKAEFVTELAVVKAELATRKE